MPLVQPSVFHLAEFLWLVDEGNVRRNNEKTYLVSGLYGGINLVSH